MLFEKEGLQIRKLHFDDRHLLARWLSDPAVLEFYEGRDNAFDAAKVARKFYNREDQVVRCMVEYQKESVGYFQYYSLDDTMKKLYGYSFSENIYGTDQFIAAAYQNMGLGTLLVETALDYIGVQLQADRIVMDPQARNKRAIRCYEKCGFEKVKVLPGHEYHEGTFRDCLLMEFNC